MKTYTRKITNYKVLENVKELCRLCLNSTNNMIPIFDQNEDSTFATLALRIMTCVGLEITKDDNLPLAICTYCNKELEKVYSFRKKCEATNRRLKQHLIACDVETRKAVYNLQNNDKTENVYDTNNINKSVNPSEFAALKLESMIKLDYDTNMKNNTHIIDDSKNSKRISAVKLENVSKHVKALPTNNVIDDKFRVICTNELSADMINNVHGELSSSITTRLIEEGVLSRNKNNLLVNKEYDLKDIIIELMSQDKGGVTFELFEEEESESETIDSKEKGVAITNKVIIEDSTANIVNLTKIKRAGPGAGGFPCARCGRRLASAAALRRHARVHSGERPFRCSRCPRRFAQREVRARHELVHEERKPFACGACAASFTQRAALAAHARSHAPPAARALRLHHCALCAKVFLYPSGLSRHMRAHSGRVFRCARCRQGFRDQSSARRHLRCVHGATGPEPELEPE